MRSTGFFFLSLLVLANGAVLRRSAEEVSTPKSHESTEDPTLTSELVPPKSTPVEYTPSDLTEDILSTEFASTGATYRPSSTSNLTSKHPTVTASPCCISESSSSSTINSIVVTKNATTTTYWLGVPALPTQTRTTTTATAVPSPIDWNSIPKAFNRGPVPCPGSSGNTWNEDFDGTRPERVDWRDRWGKNWLTQVQNQGNCGSCWAFSTAGMVETITHIQYGIWNKRSEGELLESSPSTCATGYWPQYALDWVKQDNHGLVDYSCDPYLDSDRPYETCPDRTGRGVRFDTVYSLTSIEDQKRWLWQIGPLTCVIDCYEDFAQWDLLMGVYKHSGNDPYGLHALVVVGYDDGMEAWIVRNSWGTGFGDAGYVYIGYGEVSIDSFEKYGVTNVSPDPRARGRHSNGMIIQTGDGATHRDLEVLRSENHGNNLVRLTRQGEAPYAWSKQESVDIHGISIQHYKIGYNAGATIQGQPSLLETTDQRLREAVYWEDIDHSIPHWIKETNGEYLGLPATTAVYPGLSSAEIKGYPGFIENDNSDFTIVARVDSGFLNMTYGLAEFTRSAKTGRIQTARMVASGGIRQSGPALVHSNIGYDPYDPSSSGNLYVVAVTTDGALQMFWRTPSDTVWRRGERFASNLHVGSSPPVMIQDFWTPTETAFGGFQLLVAVNGTVHHYQRRNEDILSNPPVEGAEGKWERVGSFGTGVKHVWGLVQGAGNMAMEAVVEDYMGDLWNWQYTYESDGSFVGGAWRRLEKLP